jgi:hypothetical protein
MGHHTAIGATTQLAVATAMVSDALLDQLAEAQFDATSELAADSTATVTGNAQLDASSGLTHLEFEVLFSIATLMVVDSNTATAIPGIRQWGLLTGDDS